VGDEHETALIEEELKKSLCTCARGVLHCAGSGEVPYLKHFRWHT